jgi:integrase
MMAFLGLRVGEVVNVKLTDIDMNKHVLRVHTEKAHTLDEIYLHDKVRDDLYDWIIIHRNQIMRQNNFVLFSEAKGRINISSNWLRKEFRTVINKCGLNDVYADSEERYSKRKNRNLHRLTTHSLRHYFITKVYSNTKNPIHTQKLARHIDFKSTQVYIHSSKEELSGSLKSTFETKLDGSEFKEFAETFKAWKEMKE